MQCGSLVTYSGYDNVHRAFRDFNRVYNPAHPYVAACLCVSGIVSNTLNAIVLTRRRMRSAVNDVLTSIAICQLSIVVLYLTNTCLDHLTPWPACSPIRYSIYRALYTLTYMHVLLIAHNSGLWLACYMALARNLVVRSLMPVHANWHGNTRNARRVCAAIVFTLTVFNIPAFISFEIGNHPAQYMSCVQALNLSSHPSMVDRYFYVVQINSDRAFAHNCLLLKILFWFSGLLFKVIPCLLLSGLFLALIQSLSRFKVQRNRLLNSTLLNPVETQCQLILNVNKFAVGLKRNQRKSVSVRIDPMEVIDEPSVNGNSELDSRRPRRRKAVRRRMVDRTTMMLVILLLMFLVVEIPQGIVALCVAIYDMNFYVQIFNHLGRLIELLSLVSTNINFFVYCAMNEQFRASLIELFYNVGNHGSRAGRAFSVTTINNVETAIGRPNQTVHTRELIKVPVIVLENPHSTPSATPLYSSASSSKMEEAPTSFTASDKVLSSSENLSQSNCLQFSSFVVDI